MSEVRTIYLKEPHTPAKLINFIKTTGSVKKDERIAIYEFKETLEDGEMRLTRNFLLSEFEGSLTTLMQPGSTILASSEIAQVVEVCGHSIQFSGLCAICGKDLSISDYSGSYTSRAQINMSHDALGVTVSQQEAARIENNNAKQLITEKKLLLVLDLDQTIIHATVEPTVGEWMSNPANPNYPLLGDVHWFRLPGSNTVYYIKLRPRTREFLAQLSRIYEMHIYTMGTRHYAEAVAHVIDPDQSLFKERILSRDDSGSFEIKSIKRLFPCNEGMVVVVDDRGDVWKWPSNLIKVRPYNFFVGSGDINEPIYAASQIVSNVKEHVPPTPMLDKKDLDLIILAELKDEDDGNDDKNVMQTLNIVQDHGFEKIVNERPLLQEVTRIENARVGHRPRPVLRDDDKELDIVFNVLNNVHATYYHNLEHDPTAADSRLIMDDMRKILVGVVIVFSSVIPLDSDPTDSDIWKRAISAGAQCVTELNRNVTHVVSAKRGTGKVIQARSMFGVASVGVEWLYDSIAEWKRLEVTNYLLEPMCQNRVLISIDTTKEEEIDPSDEAIVSGLWEHKDDVYIKFGQDDWNSMNKEIEEAMDDTSEDDLQQDDEEEYDWDELLDGELEVALNDESYTRNSSMTPPLTRKRLRSNDEDSNHSSGSAKGKRK